MNTIHLFRVAQNDSPCQACVQYLPTFQYLYYSKIRNNLKINNPVLREIKCVPHMNTYLQMINSVNCVSQQVCCNDDRQVVLSVSNLLQLMQYVSHRNCNKCNKADVCTQNFNVFLLNNL